MTKNRLGSDCGDDDDGRTRKLLVLTVNNTEMSVGEMDE